MTEAAVETKSPVPSLKEQLSSVSSNIEEAIRTYKVVLSADSLHYENKELAQKAKEESDQHIKELDRLQECSAEFFNNPAAFETRTVKYSKDEGVFKVVFGKRDAGEIKYGEENAQEQLSFYLHDRAIRESRRDIIESISLTGLAADRALEEIFEQSAECEIVVNTIKVFKDESGRIRPLPQAGVRAVQLKDNSSVVSGGVKFIGALEHVHDFIDPAKKFTKEEFETLRWLILKLSGRSLQNVKNTH